MSSPDLSQYLYDGSSWSTSERGMGVQSGPAGGYLQAPKLDGKRKGAKPKAPASKAAANASAGATSGGRPAAPPRRIMPTPSAQPRR
jgi:hypothetical protein